MGRIKLNYDENIFKELKTYAPNTTDTTIKTYVYNLMMISQYFDEPLDVELFQEFDIIKEYLTSHNYSMNTIKNKVSSIISYLKMKKEDAKLIEKYKDYFDMLDSRILRNAHKMQKSEKEEKNWVTKDELLKQLEYLKSQLSKDPNTYGEILKWMKYIILLIHITYPFRNDLSSAEIIKGDDKMTDDINYILINKKQSKFIIQAYKTKRTYKKKDINIIPNISNEIIKYEQVLDNYKNKNNIQNKLFLIDRKGNKFSTNDFTIFFKSIFENINKDITATIIRKIIVSSLYDVKAIKELSGVMMHSPGTALQFYAKE